MDLLDIESIGKDVTVLDHRREIFINKSDTNIDQSIIKDMRHSGKIVLHEEIEGGPISFDRLPMSIDSLTILKRIQQRKHEVSEQNDNNLVLLGSGIQRLITSEDSMQRVSVSTECEHSKTKKSSLNVHNDYSIDKENDNSTQTFDTVSINTKSYNTSANTKQKFLKVIDFLYLY